MCWFLAVTEAETWVSTQQGVSSHQQHSDNGAGEWCQKAFRFIVNGLYHADAEILSLVVTGNVKLLQLLFISFFLGIVKFFLQSQLQI